MKTVKTTITVTMVTNGRGETDSKWRSWSPEVPMMASICPLRTRRLSLLMTVCLSPFTSQGSLNSDSRSYQGIWAAVSTCKHTHTHARVAWATTRTCQVQYRHAHACRGYRGSERIALCLLPHSWGRWLPARCSRRCRWSRDCCPPRWRTAPCPGAAQHDRTDSFSEARTRL